MKDPGKDPLAGRFVGDGRKPRLEWCPRCACPAHPMRTAAQREQCQRLAETLRRLSEAKP